MLGLVASYVAATLGSCTTQLVMATTKFDIPKDFSVRLKTFREVHRYSQAKLAELLGVATNYVGMLEGGTRQPSGRLAKAFDEIQARVERLDALKTTEPSVPIDLEHQPVETAMLPSPESHGPDKELREILTFCESLRQLDRPHASSVRLFATAIEHHARRLHALSIQP